MGEPADVVRSKNDSLNAHDAKELMRHYGPEVEVEAPGATLRGPDQVVVFFSAFWEAFPDLQVTATKELEQGPFVADEGTIGGTHLGTLRTPAGDIPPTGRRADLAYSVFYEVQGGLIVSAHLHFDRLTLLEQLGLAPAPAHT